MTRVWDSDPGLSAAAEAERRKAGRGTKAEIAPVQMTRKQIDAAATACEKRAEHLLSWAVKTGNRDKLAGMIEAAKPYLTRSLDELDADPYLFNVENGTLELPLDPAKPVRIREHSKRDLITKVAPVAYDPNAVAPRWRKHLDWAFPPDREKEKAIFLQRLAGSLLVGDTRDQAFFFFWGSGGNGKSVVTDCWQYILGDHSVVLPFATLIQNVKAPEQKSLTEAAG